MNGENFMMKWHSKTENKYGFGDAFVLKVDEKYLNGLWNISYNMAVEYIQWKEHKTNG